LFSPYHLKFLHHLVEHGVAFLIIGGQARHLINPDHHTRDLDIWVRIEREDRPTLNAAVDGWAQEHPMHAITLGPGRDWRPGVQIRFPDGDGVWFEDRSGIIREVGTKDGIDMLTSLHDLGFDACMRRARRNDVDGISVFSLCPDDLEVSARAVT
jgi:hypothetical protein